MSIEKHVKYHLKTLSGNLLYSIQQFLSLEYLRYFKNLIWASAEKCLACLQIWGEGILFHFTFFLTERLLMIFSTTGPSASTDSYIVNTIQELMGVHLCYLKTSFIRKMSNFFFLQLEFNTQEGFLPLA